MFLNVEQLVRGFLRKNPVLVDRVEELLVELIVQLNELDGCAAVNVEVDSQALKGSAFGTDDTWPSSSSTGSLCWRALLSWPRRYRAQTNLTSAPVAEYLINVGWEIGPRDMTDMKAAVGVWSQLKQETFEWSSCAFAWFFALKMLNQSITKLVPERYFTQHRESVLAEVLLEQIQLRMHLMELDDAEIA